jgi:Ni/Fe-hydrogenase b-type cytochrome subunit
MTPPSTSPASHFTDTAVPGYRWVYLWQWPIRAMHWIAAAAIVVLVVTGFYIGRPYFITGGEETPRHIMAWMRFVHFGAAGIIIATGIVRVYWLFAGNKFERWKALLPVTPREWLNGWRTIKYYLMIQPHRAPHYLGHNPLQKLSYTGIYTAMIVQVVTGFAMYGLSNPGGFFDVTFGWVSPLLGGIQVVRFVHHVLTWVFIIFFPIHLYLALRADMLERSGTVSSIVSGGRFVRDDVDYADD